MSPAVVGALLVITGARPAACAGDAPPQHEQATSIASAPASPDTGMPVLPLRQVDVRYVPPKGRTVRVGAGDNLQSAIDAAKGGDILLLAPGAVFEGNFVLRHKSSDGLIVIRTATPDADLPAQGTRITPADSAKMPIIQTRNFTAAIATESGAGNYRLIGLNITASSAVSDVGVLVNLGDASEKQTDLSQVPTRITIDRSWIHGHASLQLRRCVGLHSSWSAIVDSYLSDCHSRGFDTQAIWGGNGPGPYRIENNFLEGSGENVMFGGGDPKIRGLIPSDIVIRHNYFYKPLAWQGGVWTAKNLLELKNSRRVLIEGNVFENSWVDGQTGFAMNLKSQNQDGGCPWCVTRDVTIRYNRIVNTAGGIVFSAQQNGTQLNEPLHTVLVQNNTFCKLGGRALDPRNDNGRLFLVVENISNIRIDHNTGGAPNSVITFDVGPKMGFQFTNNAVSSGAYGIQGSGAGQGTAAFVAYTPAATVRQNAIIGDARVPYPVDTAFYRSWSAAGVANPDACDFRVSASSALRRGTMSIGADADSVARATSGVDRR